MRPVAQALLAALAHQPLVLLCLCSLDRPGKSLMPSSLLRATARNRIARLIASYLAYLWVVYLGTYALDRRWLARIHRLDRCDLSLFQLGLRLITYCLCEGKRIPCGFLVPATPPPLPGGSN